MRMHSNPPKYLIVGAGFSGAVMARELVETGECFVDIWDERDHIAGNCHTARDGETGVMLHAYGPHIFNTDDERVWCYVNRHGVFRPFVNRVKASTSHGVFSLPINLHTINQFFGKTLRPSEARDFISSLGDLSIAVPRNFEEQALKMLGRELYETFFKGYTIKQWGVSPVELPASILTRLPVRFNYDDNYYSKRFQGIPEEGYTSIVQSILDHPRIKVILGKKFQIEDLDGIINAYDHIFYTGPIDAFFEHKFGRLGYRTVSFEKIDTDEADYQGNAVINYPDSSVPYTRIHEHKHFTPWENHPKTVAFREYSRETGPDDVPYYPKRLAADKGLLAKYRDLAENKGTRNELGINISFLGRLATYRYMDMEAVIREALEFAGKFAQSRNQNTSIPVFPNVELPDS